MIRNSPGPLTPCSLPARRMTNFCQALAIFSDSAVSTARMQKPMATKGKCARKASAAMQPKTTTSN